LERGVGCNKVTIRMAACGLSQSWRERNTDDLQQYSHLLNMKITTNPDISAFLDKYPMPGNHSDHKGGRDGGGGGNCKREDADEKKGEYFEGKAGSVGLRINAGAIETHDNDASED